MEYLGKRCGVRNGSSRTQVQKMEAAAQDKTGWRKWSVINAPLGVTKHKSSQVSINFNKFSLKQQLSYLICPL